MNCSIDILAANVLTGLSGMRPGRLLDIGCGYGFSADVARRLAGWDVTGVEPSAYGARGARALGFRLIDEFVNPEHPIARERFDAIFLSEVIEHVENPNAFLAFLCTMLNSGGRIILSTPDEAALREGRSESERLSALSPGAHVCLFSQSSLVALLDRRGLPYCRVARPQGVSFAAVASDVPFVLEQVEGIPAALRYLERVLADGPDDQVLVRGLRFRRFRYLIDQNRMVEALAFDSSFGDPPILGKPPRTSVEFLDRYYTYDALLLYYRGILRRHFKDPSASDFLMKAHELARRRILVAPAEAVVEANILWRALLTAANAAREAGDRPKADVAFAKLLAHVPRTLPSVPPDIRAAAAREAAT
jgi:SAM-dependent methyltransferase